MDRQKIFRWILIVLTGFACLLLFFPFILEILLAAFFTFALAPLTQYLSGKKFFKRRGWAAITLMGLICIIILPIGLLFYSMYGLIQDLTSEGFQQSELYADLIQSKTVALASINQLLSAMNLSGKVDLNAFTNQLFSGIGSKIMGFSTSIASQLPDIVLSLFIFCCAAYLFLAEGKKIKFLLTKNQLLPTHELDRLITSFQKACYSTLIGSLIVGGIQALSLSVGSLILGSQHVFLIFLVTFIFSFIPILGAAPVGFFLAFLSAVKGDYTVMVGYIVVGVFSGTIDNIIRPWLVRGDQNIHAIIMLFAIIGAIVILGLPGLFLGPMFVSAAVTVYSLYVFPPQPAAPGIDQDF